MNPPKTALTIFAGSVSWVTLARGRLAVHDGEHLRRRLAKRRLDRDGVERLSPLRADHADVGVAAPRKVLEQEAEATADHHAISGLHQRHHRRLEPRAPGAGDRERARARGLQHQARERHHLVHDRGKLRVELTEQRRRHGAQYPGIGHARPGPEEDARRGKRIGRRAHRHGGTLAARA